MLYSNVIFFIRGTKVRLSEDKTKNINIFIGLILEPGDFNLKGTKKNMPYAL